MPKAGHSATQPALRARKCCVPSICRRPRGRSRTASRRHCEQARRAAVRVRRSLRDRSGHGDRAAVTPPRRGRAAPAWSRFYQRRRGTERTNSTSEHLAARVCERRMPRLARAPVISSSEIEAELHVKLRTDAATGLAVARAMARSTCSEVTAAPASIRIALMVCRWYWRTRGCISGSAFRSRDGDRDGCPPCGRRLRAQSRRVCRRVEDRAETHDRSPLQRPSRLPLHPHAPAPSKRLPERRAVVAGAERRRGRRLLARAAQVASRFHFAGVYMSPMLSSVNLPRGRRARSAADAAVRSRARRAGCRSSRRSRPGPQARRCGRRPPIEGALDSRSA